MLDSLSNKLGRTLKASLLSGTGIGLTTQSATVGAFAAAASLATGMCMSAATYEGTHVRRAKHYLRSTITDLAVISSRVSRWTVQGVTGVVVAGVFNISANNIPLSDVMDMSIEDFVSTAMQPLPAPMEQELN